MAVYEIVFSPTGGTKKVSGFFTKPFCQESTYIDLSRRDIDFSAFSFNSPDICIVSVPSYGGRVPDIAVSRLMQLKGNNARAVLVVAYGNRAYEDTLAELQDVMGNAGFICTAAIAAVAEHSIMRQFATGRPDAQDEKELASFAAKVRSKIEQESLPDSLKLPGNRPYRTYNGVPLKPNADKSCQKCGVCARECPAGAIPPYNPSVTDTGKCISCMRCISICPQNARKLNKAMLAASSIKLKKACSGYKNNGLFL
ncbi:MAG: 4Fe-4S binding protein [Lachnospiraceae bacterium]